jgi:L-amino acid N-acyltransferase
MVIKIREYRDSDTQFILDIINYNILNSTALYDYLPRTLAFQSELLEEKLSKNYPVIVATIDDQLVGFGYYSEFRFREAYKYTVEHSVYVDKNFSNIGIGKLLLEKLIELAKKQNMHTMIAVIDSENKKSIQLHEKFGFHIVGFIKESGFKFDKWLDAVIMQLILN